MKAETDKPGADVLTPVRFLWTSYLQHCRQWGFEPAKSKDFVHWLRGEEGVRLVEGGKGLMRNVAVGLALSRASSGQRASQDGA